ncbi:hypothetical protein [Anaerostipes hominis (ex Lee et al. 2021)]|uniref:hypothetical protein n=1 Tax=Anaerostipes hominis (ex Lee et al. 2021) TaxID=2025494 RepID=UPI0022E812E9|nr:hypothetical protein [Anaerostipes hominis (ex Lee et al. 2021)]
MGKNMITAVNVIEERENGITFFEMKNDELQIRVLYLMGRRTISWGIEKWIY